MQSQVTSRHDEEFEQLLSAALACRRKRAECEEVARDSQHETNEFQQAISPEEKKETQE